MHTTDLSPWRHDHTFGLDRPARGERRTLLVATLTATFMVVEVTAGLLFGSMALLADGLHMGSHAVALGIAVLAYVYARRHAGASRFSFGTGKVNALGGFTGALLLAVFAAFMAVESAKRIVSPVRIVFDQAIAVAVLGLLVNGVSVWILGLHGHEHGDDHAHHHDHNLRSAYLHVLADALTSVLAIVALLAAKYRGLVWMDPVMGIVGSVLVARWSWGLLRDTSRVLLDHQAPEAVQERIRRAVEGVAPGDRVADLHVWTIAPGRRAACIAIVSDDPKSPEAYRATLPADAHVAHATIEVHRCAAG
jgi:cation diffusion facilitator family transporter